MYGFSFRRTDSTVSPSLSSLAPIVFLPVIQSPPAAHKEQGPLTEKLMRSFVLLSIFKTNDQLCCACLEHQCPGLMP